MVKIYYSIKKIDNKLKFDEKQFSSIVAEHIKRYKNKQAFNQSFQAWLLLDFVVQKILKKSLKEFKIEFSKRGKPVCKDFYFSISHTEEYVAVALSQKECGIDIEKVSARTKMGGIASSIFGSKENLSSEEFYSLWTYGEAAAKMLDIPVCEVKNLDENLIKKEYIKGDNNIACITCQNDFSLSEV
ncbi:MAG: hypothetical protein IJS74_02270 [Clostridia bacterium]|nr:hypothetical protein [Clostridia bacterium]